MTLRTKPIRDAISLLESILVLGESLTPDARAERLGVVIVTLRAALRPRVRVSPEAEAEWRRDLDAIGEKLAAEIRELG